MAYDRTWPLYIILDSFEGASGGNHSPPLNGSWNDCTTSPSINGTTTTNGHRHPQSPSTPEHEVHHQQQQHQPNSQPQSFCIKVRGDYSIGQVMVATTNAIPINQDWSDYAFWWPKKRQWLKSTRTTLDQADVHANDELHFTPMHKPLRLQMPDLSVVELPVDFSLNVLSTVAALATSTLAIRHPEELSLARPLSRAQIKRNNAQLNVKQTLQRSQQQQRPLTPNGTTTSSSSPSPSSSSSWLKGGSSPSRSTLNGNGTLNNGTNGTNGHHHLNISSNGNGTLGGKSNTSQLNVSYGTISSNNSLNSISNYSLGSPENRGGGGGNGASLLYPKTLLEKARLNAAWLDSSISLYEQDVAPGDLLLLRYKFFDFYDLNPKVDVARVNYIYEQLRWAIITEEVACTEDEMITLAAINLQVALASGTGRFMSKATNGNGTTTTNGGSASPYAYDSVDSPKSNGGGGFFRFNSIGNGQNGHNGQNGYSNGYGNGNGHHTVNGNGNGYHHHHYNPEMSPVDEIDSALEDLEKTLEGTYIESKPNGAAGGASANGSAYSNGGKSNGIHSNGQLQSQQQQQQHNILVVPELAEKLKMSSSKGASSGGGGGGGTLSRLKFLSSASEKSVYVILRDTCLVVYKSAEAASPKTTGTASIPLMTLNLAHRCDVRPDVLASARRFCFTIIESRSTSESGGQGGGVVVVNHQVKCRDEEQYARWYTACRLASGGRTMAHASYGEEVKKTLRLLQIQTSTKASNNAKSTSPMVGITLPLTAELEQLNIPLEEYVSPRLLKRKSKEQILRKIKHVHGNFAQESPIEAQMTFIRTCQSLRDYAITLFVVRLSKSKKEELLGVSPTQLLLLDASSGAVLRSWRYSSLIDWNVNWEVKRMTVHFNEETIEFACLSADCKVIHEFIGGYICLSMRSKANDGRLSEEDFLKLTGGWHQVPEDEEQLDQQEKEREEQLMMRKMNGGGGGGNRLPVAVAARR